MFGIFNRAESARVLSRRAEHPVRSEYIYDVIGNLICVLIVAGMW